MDTRDDLIDEGVKQRYKTTECFSLIESFLQRQKEITSELGKTKTISSVRELEEKSAKISGRDKDLGVLAVGLCLLKNQYLFLADVVQTKITYLVRSIVYGLNSDNHLLFALCARSLIEHAASLCYLVRSTTKSLDALKAMSDFKIINAKIEELRSDYIRMFYGTRFFHREGSVDALSVGKLLDKHLAHELPDIRTAYNFLCDFVHPNFGSNILVSSGQLGEGVIDPPIEEKKAIIEKVLQITAATLKYVEVKMLDFGAAGLQLDDYFKKALHPSASLKNLFTEMPPEFSGDGCSKETAIFFTNARTHREHIVMQQAYFRQAEVRVTGRRYTAALEGGFAYDLYETESGKLWFKVPATWD